MRVPVRLTDSVKEPHLRGRIGYLLADHPATDMTRSFIVDIGEGNHCQCAVYEIDVLKKDDPDYPGDAS